MLTGIRRGPRCQVWKGLATLVHDLLVFYWSCLLTLLDHPASQKVLEGIEVLDGILHVVLQRLELF